MIERIIDQNKPLIVCALSMALVGTCLVYGVMKSAEIFNLEDGGHGEHAKRSIAYEKDTSTSNVVKDSHNGHSYSESMDSKEVLTSYESSEHIHLHENEELLGEEEAEKVLSSPINEELNQIESEYYAKEDVSFEEHEEYLDSIAEVYETEGLKLHFTAE